MSWTVASPKRSKTDPGGYAEGKRRHESEQFTVSDTRPVEAIVRMVLARGYIPSLCTSCYRKSRTGHAFTEMAIDGNIRGFCLPNALLSLAEYAVASDDASLRAECLAAVEAGKRDMAGSPLAAAFEGKLVRVLAGETDHHF